MDKQIPFVVSSTIQITNIDEPTEEEARKSSVDLQLLINNSLLVIQNKHFNQKGRVFQTEAQQEVIEVIEQRLEEGNVSRRYPNDLGSIPRSV